MSEHINHNLIWKHNDNNKDINIPNYNERRYQKICREVAVTAMSMCIPHEQPSYP